MKIVIIGAGVSGLSTYFFLKKHIQSIPNQHHEIKIYEAYDVSKYLSKTSGPAANDSAAARSETERAASALLEEPSFMPEAIGGAIGIARNGLNVLSRLFSSESGGDGGTFSDILADMIREGHPTTKWLMSNARGWTLPDLSMLPRRLQGKIEKRKSLDSQRSDNGKRMSSWEDSPINLIVISRQAFWSILLRHVVAQAGVGLIQHKKVAELVIPPSESTEQTLIKFVDGTEESADLVIGADGLRSVVRNAMFQPQPRPQPSPNPLHQNPGFLKRLLSAFSWTSLPKKDKDYITPHYTGLVGVGSFIPSSVLSSTNHPPGQMSAVFGPNGFFGCGYITSSPPYPDPTSSTNAKPGLVSGFWSTFSSPSPHPYPLPTTSSDGDSKKPKPYEFDRAAALSALISRHKHWKNPTVQAILSHVEKVGGADGFFPTWTTPELPSWSKNGRAVLVGDAAHTLQPSSGQGASQGLEDAEALALLLRHYLSRAPEGSKENETAAAKKTLEKFDRLRMPRLHLIYVQSQRMGGMKSDMGFVGEMMMYAAMWLMMRLKVMEKYQKWVVEYDLPGNVESVVRDE